jgi:hypothetical protein
VDGRLRFFREVTECEVRVLHCLQSCRRSRGDKGLPSIFLSGDGVGECLELLRIGVGALLKLAIVLIDDDNAGAGEGGPSALVGKSGIRPDCVEKLIDRFRTSGEDEVLNAQRDSLSHPSRQTWLLLCIS